MKDRQNQLSRRAALFAAAALLAGGTAGGRSYAQVSSTGASAQWPNKGDDTPRSRDIFDQDSTRCPVPAECGSRISAGGISARTLAHKPPKGARKEFDRGVHAWTKGRHDEALSHLAEAVRLDPGFVEARIDLGIVYAKAGRPEQALYQDERALALEPNLAVLHSNKAAALVMLHRWEEAEQAARRAVQLAPGFESAHFMLGLAMAMQQKITPETAAHLQIAAKRYPNARKYLAAVQAALAVSPAIR